MAKRTQERDKKHRENMDRHARICGPFPRFIFAGVALHPCGEKGEFSCEQALTISGLIMDPVNAPCLPLKGCSEAQCLCYWKTVTWRKASTENQYRLE